MMTQNDANNESDSQRPTGESIMSSPRSFQVHPPPPLKRRKLAVSVCVACQQAREERQAQLIKVLADIEKLINPRRQLFQVGQNGLQAYCARTIKKATSI
jgi:hypothetical protein